MIILEEAKEILIKELTDTKELDKAEAKDIAVIVKEILIEELDKKMKATDGTDMNQTEELDKITQE